MDLTIVDAKHYNNLLKQVEALKIENDKLKKLSNNLFTFTINTNVNNIPELVIETNGIDFSKDVQDAFMKYTKDLYKPLENLITNNTNKETKTNIDTKELEDLLKYCNDIIEIYNKPKYIKFIHSEDCVYYTNQIINKINKIISDNKPNKESNRGNVKYTKNKTNKINDNLFIDIDENKDYDI